MTRASAGPPDPAPAGTPGPAYALDNTVAADSVEDDDDDDDAPLPPDPEDTPTRIGRYTIIRRIGAGGMGQVYAAYDEQLDRKIAVKVLGRDLSRGVEWNARLVREAQVMARLSHPNVVTVHEIGEYDGQLFIAMEFVAGVTLEAWLAAAPRSWRAIIAAFIDAGRGLQAAHDAGIIHRDFKANNAMIGDDGRARVLDFGIAGPGDARPGDDALSLNPNTPSALRSALTVDGALLGTPIYMSPEQLSGAAVGAASDQFNFCVALYRALYATHPFVSEPFSFSALRINVIGGRLREPPRSRGVPGWVFAALRRGLEVRPDDRFASMNQLIAALTRDPGRRLRRILALAVFAGLAGLAGFAARAGLRPTEVNCDGGEQSMAALWSPQQRGVIGASFRATGLVFADAVLTTVAADLDAYTASWAEMHRDACAAHRDGEQSGALLDKRMACLERRRQALGSAVNLLAAPDEEVVQGAVRLVSELPRISHCGDVVALAAEVPPPDDPAVAEEVSRLRGRIDAASSLAAVGRQE
ncbi:MAG: serine/threonine-protein kinase, partial [Nannocystaceae bacterium]